MTRQYLSHFVAAFIVLTALVLGVFALSLQAQAVQYALNPNVEICHASNSQSNPYGPKSQTVDASSIINLPNGHNDHDGPVWFLGITEDWGDIIPPFDYNFGSGTTTYPGKNWTTEGQAIWNKNCQTPDTEISYSLTKKFSEEYPAGYTADQFTFDITGTSDKGTAVNMLGITLSAYSVDTATADVNLPVGTYTITEHGPVGFMAGEWTVKWSGYGCSNKNSSDLFTTLTVKANDPTANVCEADNQWRPGKLTVEKVFVGTSTAPENFSFKVTQGNTEKFNGAFEADGINELTLEVGSYSVEETNYTGYTPSYSADCSGTIAQGGSKTCRITNTYNPGYSQGSYYNQGSYYSQGSYGGGNQCVDELQGSWTDAVESSSQGDTKGNGAITDVNRTNPDAVLGVSDWTPNSNDATGFFSLGFGGSIVVSYDSYVPDVVGTDFVIREATNGDSYPAETVDVEVSQDGTTWFAAGTADNSVKPSRTTDVDFSSTGLSWIKFIKITDTTDSSLHDDAADGFDLDAIEVTQQVCDEPGVEPTYLVFGYVWHDENSNTDWEKNQENDEDNEPDLSGWTVEITDGENTYSTTSDPTGYYYFYVKAGTWNINEVIQTDWSKTFPVVNGHTVVVGGAAQAEEENFFAMVMSYIVPTAYAQTPETYGPYDFGNVYVGGTGGCGTDCSYSQGSYGGGSYSQGSYGGGNGKKIELTSTTGDGSGTTGPIPQVLGESTDVLPIGAPNTGAGGASPIQINLPSLFAILSSAGRIRTSKNG